MASCTDLTKLPPTGSIRSLNKATLGPIITGKKLVEPFQRLKQRANLFRRKNFSSQLDLSTTDHRPSIDIDHIIPRSLPTAKPSHNETTNITLLKRSNSMICPQQHLPLLLKSSETRHQQRNSLCLDSTPYARSSSVNRYTHRRSYSKMTHIDENEILTLEPHEHHLVNQQEKIPRTNTITQEQQQQTTISSSTVLLRDHPDHSQHHRQSHSTTIFLSPQRQSLCSSIDEPFYDCQQISESPFEQCQNKISTYTMTGKSLYNLHQTTNSTLSSPKSSSLTTSASSSEEKGVQTTFQTIYLSKTTSSTSLSSSSSTSIKTDSLEHQSASIKQQQQQTTSPPPINQVPSQKKWPHMCERLLGEQTCIYWVNYLGSTAIKMSFDNPIVMPTTAMTRLKQSTQHARVLPIIGLSISSRGVQFLKHTKDRHVICFHEIKSIHCACQDQDLRYFAYVTREQRLQRDSSYSNLHGNSPVFEKQQQQSDFHHYCHVFVVKTEAMSTEIMLTFGQAFDVAYRLHQHDQNKLNMDNQHVPTKFMSSSILSIDEQRKAFI